ncbi:hypothetical protein Tco_0833971 [Tanacetum coccineum]
MESQALIWELPAAVGSNRFGIDPLSMYTNGAEINQIDATVIDATVSLLKTEFVNKFQESAKRIFPLCKSYLLINEFIESRSQIKCGLVNHAFAAALLFYW